MFSHANVQDSASSVFSFTSNVFFAVAMTGRYLLHNPSKAMVMFLSVARARSTDLPKPAIHLRDPFSSSDTTQERPCFPEHELFVHYHVMSNVKDLRKIKYFIFPENHTSIAHHEQKGHFASTLLTANDWLLFESAEVATFNCRDVCLHKGGESLFFYNHVKYTDGKHPDCKWYFNFSDNLHCESWEDPLSYQRAGKLMDQGIEIEKKIALLHEQIPKLKQFLSSISIQAQSGQIQQRDVNIIYDNMIKIQDDLDYVNQFFTRYNSSFPANKADGVGLKNNITFFKKTGRIDTYMLAGQYRLFVADFDFLAKTLKTMGAAMNREIIVRQRNKGLINKPGLFESTESRKMIFLGLDHILTPIISGVKYLIDKIQKQDPAFELRKKLEHHPHAILIPKDVQITKNRR